MASCVFLSLFINSTQSPSPECVKTMKETTKAMQVRAVVRQKRKTKLYEQRAARTKTQQ